MVSWADRIAYVCHDFEDAVRSGIVTPAALPAVVRERCGDRRGRQLGTFIDALVDDRPWPPGGSAWPTTRPRRWPPSGPATTSTSTSGRARSPRARPSSTCCRPWSSTSATGPTSSRTPGPDDVGLTGGEPGAVRAAVAYVAGMTDRFAFSQAVALLGWDPDKLPVGIGVTGRF